MIPNQPPADQGFAPPKFGAMPGTQVPKFAPTPLGPPPSFQQSMNAPNMGPPGQFARPPGGPQTMPTSTPAAPMPGIPGFKSPISAGPPNPMSNPMPGMSVPSFQPPGASMGTGVTNPNITPTPSLPGSTNQSPKFMMPAFNAKPIPQPGTLPPPSSSNIPAPGGMPAPLGVPSFTPKPISTPGLPTAAPPMNMNMNMNMNMPPPSTTTGTTTTPTTTTTTTTTTPAGIPGIPKFGAMPAMPSFTPQAKPATGLPGGMMMPPPSTGSTLPGPGGMMMPPPGQAPPPQQQQQPGMMAPPPTAASTHTLPPQLQPQPQMQQPQMPGMMMGGSSSGAPLPPQHQQPPSAMQSPQNMPYNSNLPPSLPMMQNTPVIPPHVVPPNPRIISASSSLFPANLSLLTRSNLSLGIVLRPLAEIPPSETPVPVVDFGASGVVRCLQCRAYISAYVRFQDNGQHWCCNFCNTINVVPDPYYCPLDNSGYRQDLPRHVELTESVYEAVATDEYHVQPPVIPTYIFVIDISTPAIESGLVEATCKAIKGALPELPGGVTYHNNTTAKNRVKVAFITVNANVQYYIFPGNGKRAYGVSLTGVSSDTTVETIPHIETSLAQNMQCIEDFLDNLPKSLIGQPSTPDIALHKALRLINTLKCQSKVLTFLSGLPNIPMGALQNRALGISNKKKLDVDMVDKLILPPQQSDYITILANSRSLRTYDFFLCNPTGGFMDVPEFSRLPHATSGEVRVIDGFHKDLHTEKLVFEVHRVLTRLTGWDGVLRLRMPSGINVKNVVGNLSVRSKSLIVLPTMDSDKTITFELKPDESIVNLRSIYLQSALLYTTFNGERRIRVSTLCLPLTHALPELYESLSPNALVNVMVKEVLTEISSINLGLARSSTLITKVLNIMRTYRSVLTKPNHDYGALGCLPLMCLGVVKSCAFKESSDVPLNVRSFLLGQLRSIGLVELETFVRPRLLCVSNLTGNEGLVDPETNTVALPNELSLSMSFLNNQGISLIDNGFDMFIFVGSQCTDDLLASLFVASPYGPQLAPAPQDMATGTTLLHRIHNIINQLRGASGFYQIPIVLRQGDPLPIAFQAMFAEDVQGNIVSLNQFASLMAKP